MLNRRSFLKTGLTAGAAVPVSTVLNSLEGTASATAEETPQTADREMVPNLVALPARLAPIDPASQPWQQRVRRVGQSNMTEHDPAVMNIEEWADYWHRTEADLVF